MNFFKGIISKIKYDTEMRGDLLKIGTMLVVSRIFKDRDLKGIDNKKFLTDTFATLAGFAIYHLFAKDQIEKIPYVGDKKIVRVALKIACIILVQRLVKRKGLGIQGGSYMVAGFVAHELLKDCLNISQFFGDERLKRVADDLVLAALTTFMPRIVRGGRITKRVIGEVIAKTVGFAAYSLFLA